MKVGVKTTDGAPVLCRYLLVETKSVAPSVVLTPAIYNLHILIDIYIYIHIYKERERERERGREGGRERERERDTDS